MYVHTYTLSTLEYHTYGNQSAHDIMEFCSVNMDASYYRNNVACDIMV
jgi:hypothetical protein